MTNLFRNLSINKDYQAMISEDTVREHNRAEDRFRYSVHESDLKNESVEYAFMKMSAENPYSKQVEMNIKLCQAIKEEDTGNLAKNMDSLRWRTYNEVRSLEDSIRAAYISKTLSIQNMERKALADEKRLNNHKANEDIRYYRWGTEEFQRKSREETREKQREYKQGLLDQLCDKKKKQQEEKERIEEEKRQWKEDVRQCEEQMQKEANEKIEKKKLLKEDLDAYMRVRAQWKGANTKGKHEAQDSSMGLLWQSRDQSFEKEKLKKELLQKKIKIGEKISKDIEQKLLEKQKFQDNLIDLLIDEGDAKEEMKCKQKRERQLQDVITAQLNYKQEMLRKDLEQLELKKQKRLEFEIEQDQVKQYKREQRILADQKRATMLKNRKEMEDHIQSKHLYKATEINNNIRDDQKLHDFLKKRDQNVEKARMDLITEHGKQVYDFLPGKRLQQSERDYLATMVE